MDVVGLLHRGDGVLGDDQPQSASIRLRSTLVSDRITAADVTHVAKHARLELTAEELDRYTHQLASMLEHFADIDALDLSDVEPMTQPYPLVNVLRDDVVGPTLSRDEVLAMAPDAESGRFKVPAILGDAP